MNLTSVDYGKIDTKRFTFIKMTEVTTARIKYIYLDVVGFTHNRTVEAQVKIVSALNRIVKASHTNSFPKLEVIYIPIGDGICICLLDSKVYDDYITIAEEIIRRINAVYNPRVKQSVRFQVRIGINENVDNIITDINGNPNVCGAGVNEAQRIMNFGDSNHILLGRSVADSLLPREKYAGAFRRYIGTAKHNTSIEIYQYISGIVPHLNRDPPHVFSSPTEKALTQYAAYYIAIILRNREFIAAKIEKDPYLTLSCAFTLAVQMAYLAEDSLGRSKQTRLDPYINLMPKAATNTLEKQFEFFWALPFGVTTKLHDALVSYRLADSYSDCFEPEPSLSFVVPSEKGEQKLQNEWPEIYKEFNNE
jgi:hypothetical protein